MFSYLPTWMRPKSQQVVSQPHSGKLQGHHQTGYMQQPPTGGYTHPHRHPTTNTYASQQPQSSILCQGCGMKPKFVESNGRVHDYCGKTCKNKYIKISAPTAISPQMTGPPLCPWCGRNPCFVENDGRVHGYCGKSCARKHRDHQASQLQPTYSCKNAKCNEKSAISDGYCPKHDRGARLSVQTASIGGGKNGPKTAMPRPAPPPPPMRKYSLSNPLPGPGSRGPTKIMFYDKNDAYYEFTNFSNHPIVYRAQRYATSEHLFQALKFLDHQPGIAGEIRSLATPRDVYNMAQQHKQYVRPDWFSVNIAMMDIVLLHKFQQHGQLRDLLLSTGDAELIEDSPTDSFWGIGRDQSGRNELGKALMRLRSKFQRGEA